MSKTRRFLLVLVLASVTCLLVVQVTIDSWRRTDDYSYSEEDIRKKEVNAEQLSMHSTSTMMPKTSQIKKASNTLTVTQSESVTKSQSISDFPKKFKSVDKAIEAETKVQVKQLKLANNPSKSAKPQRLVAKQDRIKELLKQSSVIHARSTFDPMKSLIKMPIVAPSNVTRILVLTYFRAGSSFFGDLLQQNWKTFYHFEPLHSMTYNSRIADDKAADAFSLLNGAFRCNFTELNNYMQWVKKPHNQFLFAHNLFLWVTCRSISKTCFNSSFVNAVCQRAPVHVMKITRLHMRHLRSYLQENPDLNIKVIYLTRDPRGIVSSRWTLDWCNGTDCSNANVLCNDMSEDIKIFEDLQRNQPLNFIKVRYEDMSLNPEKETRRLFQFLHLPFSLSVQKFLKTHTVGRQTDNKNPYSTRRNTTAMAFSWHERVTYDQVLDIQSSCEQVLYRLNHSVIVSPDQLPYPNGTQKLNYISHKINSEEFQKTSKSSNLSSTSNKSESLKDNFGKRKTLAPYSTVSAITPHLNNTNIEIHKTYKVLSVPKKVLEEAQHLPQKDTTKR